MAIISYLCPILICVLCVRALHSFKELYCQDPDTKMLHPVNTTWGSRTFCGNYTCKLRKRNQTNSDSIAPLRKINITNININLMKSEEDMSHSASHNIQVNQEIKPGMTNLQRKQFTSDNKADEEKRSGTTNDQKDTDRYLTESEIRTITDMLHSVKKSDLEAIVDIYNLAQDIYKDIEKGQDDSIIQDTMTPIHSHSSTDNKVHNTNKDKQRVSYWYEPLDFHNNKVKQDDMNDATTTVSTTTTQPIKIKDGTNSYFKGSLSEKDIRKLPYYYPMSSFQRVSSYIHTTKSKSEIEPAASETKSCKKPPPPLSPPPVNNYALPPWINKSLKKNYFPVTPQNVFEPSVLLPFPFAYVNNNNLTGYPPSFYYDGYSGYPWAQLNIFNRNRNYHQSYLGTAYLARVPGESIYIKPEINTDYDTNRGTITRDDIIDIISSLKDKEMKKMPDWQTNSLPEKVIEEIRGNAEKSKIIKPLRKKVRIERIGKLIKLDETLRTKRDTGVFDDFHFEVDEYETYITRTTCQPSTEIGYFRRGNMSRTYPDCCPQRIES